MATLGNILPDSWPRPFNRAARALRLPQLAEHTQPLLRRLIRPLWIALGWVPLTPFGIIAIGLLSAGVRYYSGTHTDLIVCTVCLGGLVICALSILIVLAAGLWFRFRKEDPPTDEPLELDAGLRSPTDYHLGPVSLPPLLHFEIRWQQPEGVNANLAGERKGWQEEVLARNRGLADRIVRQITVRDWLSLARVRFCRTTERPVRMLPWCGRGATFELIQQFRPGDMLGHPEGTPVGDLVEMRRYVSGDPLKLVLWKAYARTGRMLVRTPERSVTPTDRMMAYFVPAAGDEPAAGIARAAIELGLLGPEVLFMAEGAQDPATSPAIGVDQIIRSVGHRARGGEGLDRFLVRGESVGTSAAFLFVSPEPGPWLARVCQTLSQHRGPFEAVVGVDGVVSDSESRRWRRWLLNPPSSDLANHRGLLQVCRELAGAGVRVRVISRATGQNVTLDTRGAVMS